MCWVLEFNQFIRIELSRQTARNLTVSPNRRIQWAGFNRSVKTHWKSVSKMKLVKVKVVKVSQVYRLRGVSKVIWTMSTKPRSICTIIIVGHQSAMALWMYHMHSANNPILSEEKYPPVLWKSTIVKGIRTVDLVQILESPAIVDTFPVIM